MPFFQRRSSHLKTITSIGLHILLIAFSFQTQFFLGSLQTFKLHKPNRHKEPKITGIFTFSIQMDHYGKLQAKEEPPTQHSFSILSDDAFTINTNTFLKAKETSVLNQLHITKDILLCVDSDIPWVLSQVHNLDGVFIPQLIKKNIQRKGRRLAENQISFIGEKARVKTIKNDDIGLNENVDVLLLRELDHLTEKL